MLRRVLRVAFGWFCLVAAQSLSAQTIRSIRYGLEDGMPSVQVLDVDQFADGRLLLATGNGLVIYDGRTWSQDPALLPSRLRSASRIAKDAQGDLWVGSQVMTEPTARQRGNEWEYIDPPPAHCGRLVSLSHPNQVFKFCPGPGGERLLMGDGEVLDGLGANGWEQLVSREDLGSSIRGVEWFDGAYVVAADSGLRTLRDGVFYTAHEDLLAANGNGGAVITDLARDRSRLWVVGGSWIGRIEGGDFRVLVEDPGKIYPGAHLVLISDGAGGLLLGVFASSCGRPIVLIPRPRARELFKGPTSPSPLASIGSHAPLRRNCAGLFATRFHSGTDRLGWLAAETSTPPDPT